jgi:hypothetical protein
MTKIISSMILEELMKKRFLSVLACILAAVLCVGIFGKTTTFAKGKTDASTVTGKVMKLTKKSKATNEEMIRGYNRFSIKTLRVFKTFSAPNSK